VALTLWVARHAEVAAEGLCYGQLDVSPRISHRDAAALLEGDLGAFRPERVWTSPLPRCLGVATELSLLLARPLSVEPQLLELSFGAWEGRRWADLEAEDGARLAAWMEDWTGGRPPGGESVAELTARVEAWLASLEGDACVLTHSGVIRALRVLLTGVSWREAMAGPVPYLAWERFRR